jgi:hypothetical protein
MKEPQFGKKDLLYKKPPHFTQEDIQIILDALLFMSSVDVSGSNTGSYDEQKKFITILQKFSSIGWKGSSDMSIFSGELNDTLISDFIITNNLLERR